jgi:hypothetical protein
MTKAPKSALETHLRQIREEGQGVWRIEAFSAENVLQLALRALRGDVEAARWMYAFEPAVRQIAGKLCLLCDHEFSRESSPALWVVISAWVDQPTSACLQGLCAACADEPDAKERVLAKLRADVMPDLRIIPLPHREAGHG